MASNHYPDSKLLSGYPDNTDICFSSSMHGKYSKTKYFSKNAWPVADETYYVNVCKYRVLLVLLLL